MGATTEQRPTPFKCGECGAAVVLEEQTRHSNQRSWVAYRKHVCIDDFNHEIGDMVVGG